MPTTTQQKEKYHDNTVEWANWKANAGSYVNFMTEDEGDRVAAVYGANYDRLVQIEKRYDPDNIFHLNQNIKSQSWGRPYLT